MLKKQIIYADFSTRIMSILIDFAIISWIMGKPIKFLAKHIILYYLGNHIKEYNIDPHNYQMIFNIINSGDIKTTIPPILILKSYLLINLSQITFVSAYFISFCYKFSTSPGKFILGYKIVEAKSERR